MRNLLSNNRLLSFSCGCIEICVVLAILRVVDLVASQAILRVVDLVQAL